MKGNFKITSKRMIEIHYDNHIKWLKNCNFWENESTIKIIKKTEEKKEEMLKLFDKQGYVNIYKTKNDWTCKGIDQ